MKICMLSAFYHPITAGSEVFTKEISERLAADGHEVHVVTGSWMQLKPYEEINGVKVHRVPSVLAKNIALASVVPGMFLKGLHIAKDCDLIHAHLAFPPGTAGAIIKKLTGKPLITTVQGGDAGIYPNSGLGKFFPIVKPLVNYCLTSSNCVTAISKFLAEKAKDLGAKDVILLRNGTDTKKFNPDVPVEAVREKYRITGQPLILTVSRLVPKNGVDTLIAAFAKLSGELPTAHLVIAGDGPELSNLQKQAKATGVIDRIHFLGYVGHDDIPALMNLADVFVRVSVEEGLGIVFAEALACKTPVVGTKVGGIPDIVKDCETGLLVDPGNVCETARAIKNILSNEKLASELVEAGYDMVLREFSWESIYAKTKRLYKKVIDATN